ncbi:MAG: CinA family protein, partial [Gammaproteobacteria bacterium]|nr:CinA family protein [Gammaproteobacteria bacterium]
ETGAVRGQTVREMASGALKNSRAQIAVAISGIAGPGGGSDEKPVGTVCLAWADDSTQHVETRLFSGDRDRVRQQAVVAALRRLIELSRDDGE